nr:unknown [uncultured bacterium]
MRHGHCSAAHCGASSSSSAVMPAHRAVACQARLGCSAGAGSSSPTSSRADAAAPTPPVSKSQAGPVPGGDHQAAESVFATPQVAVAASGMRAAAGSGSRRADHSPAASASASHPRSVCAVAAAAWATAQRRPRTHSRPAGAAPSSARPVQDCTAPDIDAVFSHAGPALLERAPRRGVMRRIDLQAPHAGPQPGPFGSFKHPAAGCNLVIGQPAVERQRDRLPVLLRQRPQPTAQHRQAARGGSLPSWPSCSVWRDAGIVSAQPSSRGSIVSRSARRARRRSMARLRTCQQPGHRPCDREKQAPERGFLVVGPARGAPAGEWVRCRSRWHSRRRAWPASWSRSGPRVPRPCRSRLRRPPWRR